MWITSSLQAAKAPTDIALGNFDGVHLGHQRVMAEVAPRCPITDDPQRYATVVTFSPHPRAYFSGIARPLLTPVEEKARQLDVLGIQQLVMLPFNQALATLSPEAFVKQILVDGLNAQRISVGSDFHFGKGRAGNAQMLKQIAASYGVPVVLVPLKELQGDRISSSRIRAALQSGELSEATRLLGRPYSLTGKVVQGKQLGRTIGFPTANLQVPSEKFLPRTGVYSVWAELAAPKTKSQPTHSLTEEPTPQLADQLANQLVQGVMNIGTRPTVSGQGLSVEVHLLDWSGDLYEQRITVYLQQFIRAEQKFDGLPALKAQIEKDCETARESLGDRPNLP